MKISRGKKKDGTLAGKHRRGTRGKEPGTVGYLVDASRVKKKGLYQKNTHTKKIIRGDKKMKKKRK